MTLSWKSGGGAPASFIVEAGTAAGGTDRLATDTGPATMFTRTAVPGLYYVRVRARNACGISNPSREITVSVRLAATKPDVVVAEHQGERQPFFPSVERLANGELLVVYYDSPDHISPAGRISTVRSADNGATWSAPQVIVDTPLDDRDPSIMQTRDGRLLVSFFTRDGQATEVFVVQSDDGGRRWSAPVPVGTRLSGSTTDARIVELEDGELIIPLSGRMSDGAEIRGAIGRSADHGRTWPADREIVLPVVTGIDFVEPALANLGRGRLLAIGRSERSDNRAYTMSSSDGGRSWSHPEKLMVSAEASDLVPLARSDGSRAIDIIHTWADFSQQFGEGRPTLIQLIAIDQRGTPAFGTPHLVYHGRCSWGDEGYPSSVVLADGRVFTVYYDACARYVAGTFTTRRTLDKKD